MSDVRLSAVPGTGYQWALYARRTSASVPLPSRLSRFSRDACRWAVYAARSSALKNARSANSSGRYLAVQGGIDSLESVNALVEERCAKVDHWQNSSQRHRWLATALLDIEPRLRKVMGYRHLPRRRDALKRELTIDTTTSKKKAA